MSENKTNINWFPGHMAKTQREITEDLKLIDVVIELLDARIPYSSRNPVINKIVKGKKKIILLNKSDLSDPDLNNLWKDKLSKEAPTILTDSNSGRGIDKVTKQIDALMEEELKKQAARGRINKTIRVMILGIPNVGKSSFINRITKKQSLEVGNKPGVTRKKQWIRIGKNQELMDTPGVLWPKFESEEVSLNLAFTGTIKDDILERTEIAYELLKKLHKDYKKELYERYKISEVDDKEVTDSANPMYTLMKIIGKKRGALVSGGEVDDEKVSRIILDDFRSGKIGKITLEKP
ncbi:MAG: ribosome biogenesis GTPase YlqF [Clostridia bacterium]|nr:ribosome biogenesis GTPase YlqF [Clostridia bacterium]